MQPAKKLEGVKSASLEGKRIIIGITGSIAAVKCVELARELIRRGAEVRAAMSGAAQEIVHRYAIEYATGHDVITEITGFVEHVDYFDTADLFLIAPCTANTIGKVACGIDDTPVTTFATVAFGRKIPILIAPAMHEPMYDNPAVARNIGMLRSAGVIFIEPKKGEETAKMADIDAIIINVERALSEGALRGKKVVITSGATMESIDPIRVLTNRSSGRTGREIAKEAFRQGADVTIVHSGVLGVDGIKEIKVESVKEMGDAVMKELKARKYNLFISAAAISDFTVRRAEKKIPSSGSVTLQLVPARKLIADVRKAFPKLKIVGFKAETNLRRNELIEKGKAFMRSSALDMVVANDVGRGGIGEEENEVDIISKGEVANVKGRKEKIAAAVIKRAADLL
jgi:phosphopantothenoylcysteine decarboxylase/phosphopantothenate--cysteine ligase